MERYACPKCGWTYKSAIPLAAEPLHPCPTKTSAHRAPAKRVLELSK